MTSEHNDPSARCRLVLVVPEAIEPDAAAARLAAAGAGGDIASVIVPGYGTQAQALQALVERLVPVAHRFDAAVIVGGEARIAARAGADGIHLPADPPAVGRAVADLDGRLIVGAEAGRTRHQALEVGEGRPDYVFFGRPGGDTHAEPHPGVLEHARWWAEFVEIPAIVMGGHALSTLDAAAGTGADFVALSRAVFEGGTDPAAVVREANRILEGHRLSEAA